MCLASLPHVPLYPTTGGGMQNESLVGMCAHCIHVFFFFGTFGACSVSVLINKLPASELSRRECVVGWVALGKRKEERKKKKLKALRRVT